MIRRPKFISVMAILNPQAGPSELPQSAFIAVDTIEQIVHNPGGIVPTPQGNIAVQKHTLIFCGTRNFAVNDKVQDVMAKIEKALEDEMIGS